MEKYCSKCKNKFDQSFNYCPFCGNKRIKNIKSNKLPDYNKQEQLARENESPEFLEQIKKLKNVSLILGIFSIFGGGFFVAIFGLTFGILYRKKTKDFCIGIWINIFVIIIDIVVLLGLFLSNFNGDNVDNNLNEFITIGDQYTGYITLSDEWKKIKS